MPPEECEADIQPDGTIVIWLTPVVSTAASLPRRRAAA